MNLTLRSRSWEFFTTTLLAAISIACDSTVSNAPSADAASQPSASRTVVHPDDSTAIEPTTANTVGGNYIRVPSSFVVPSRRDATALPAGLLAVDDVNGDAIVDIIACLKIDSAGTERSAQVVAFSGADQSVLWMTNGPIAGTAKTADGKSTEEAPSIEADGVRALPDMNSDEIGDIFVAARGSRGGFAVLSGKDGTVLGINATPKDEIDHLVDARDIDGDAQPDLVFAVRLHDDAPNQPADRMSFAVYSGVHYKRVVSFKKPFNRLGVRQTLLFGGFPDTNADGVPEILCFGESAPIRDRPQEGHFAMVVGQLFKRWVLTRAGFDPTTTDSFIACPGIIAPDSFADLIISTPVGTNMPSQLGLYVLKQQKFEWTLTGGGASAEISQRLSGHPKLTIDFGAPVIPVPDQDDDGLKDVATICSNPTATETAVLVVLSSRSGRILQAETGEKKTRIEADHRRVQLTLLPATDGAATDRIAVTGRVDGTPQPTPALLIFDLNGASAKHP